MIEKILVTIVGIVFGLAAILSRVAFILLIPAALLSWYFNDWSLFGKIILYGCLLFLVFLAMAYAYAWGLEALRYFKKSDQRSKHFNKSTLEIEHLLEMPIQVESVQFVNTENRRKASINVNNRFLRNPFSEKGTEESLWSRNNQFIVSIFNTFNGDQYLPVGANKFSLTYYSFVEGLYYHVQGTFSAQEFAEKSLCEYGHQGNNMVFFIRPEGVVELKNYRHQTIAAHIETKVVALSEKKKSGQIEAYLDKSMTHEEFSALLDKVKTSGRLQKAIDMHTRLFHWKLSYTGPDEIVSITTADFCQPRCSSEYLQADSIGPQLLPRGMIIHLMRETNQRNYGIHLQLDKEKLYWAVLGLTAENASEPIDFSIAVNDADKGVVQVLLSSRTQTLKFTDCEIDFHEYSLVEMDSTSDEGDPIKQPTILIAGGDS